MRRDGKRALGVMVMLASAALAAGCTSGRTGVSLVVSSDSPSARPARLAPLTAQAPKRRARADAAAILASFVPPPGARRLAKPPAVPGGWLRTPQTFLVTNAGVDDVSFWVAPGKPAALLAWEAARVSRRFTPGDADYGPPSWDRMFDLPPVPGVLTSRSLVVEVVAIGHGQAGIRVDAEVGYQPPRPAGEKVPAAALAVTVAEVGGGIRAGGRAPAPVTITDPKVVAALAALIDSLPLSTIPDSASCPLPLGSVRLLLTFRAAPGERPLAVARTGQACERVSFTVEGGQWPALTGTTPLDGRIVKTAGLPWNVS